MTQTTRPHGDHEAPQEVAATDRWVALQRGVAAGMLVTFGLVMVVLAQALVPPLAVAGVLFAVPLVVSFVRPRGAAIAIGIVATLWFALQVANAARVLPDLLDPAAGLAFAVTVAMVVIPAAGVVGLVGLLRRAAPSVAVRTLQAAGAVVVVAIGAGTVAGVLTDDAPAVVSDGPATVILRDFEFQPAAVQVPAGTTVTWEWADGQVEHDVVGDGFASEVTADGTFRHTFDAPGTYGYECTLHPGMTRTVLVVPDDGSAGDRSGGDRPDGDA